MRSSPIWVTANDRFKSRSEDWMSVGVVAAVVAHFSLFAFFPTLDADDMRFTGDEIETVDLPPEVRIPPPPDDISRPAMPRVDHSLIDENITIDPTDFVHNPVENLPPPPAGARPSDVPAYIPRDVEPRRTNDREITRLLEQRYPSMLKEAGIGGSVVLYIFVDETGTPINSQVTKSSGYPQFDAVALEVADRMRFSPAMNRDKPVGVWTLQQIDFKTK
ncbi:MAG: energy transducer TonB [Gemmatimonadota bacterium]|nr:energy transducer TonB [Gemmatimonadota bacterium]